MNAIIDQQRQAEDMPDGWPLDYLWQGPDTDYGGRFDQIDDLDDQIDG